jgi:hypothetical protein
MIILAEKELVSWLKMGIERWRDGERERKRTKAMA